MRNLPGHRGYNCNLNIFHVHGLRYKMLITPTFDSQTMLFIRILKKHNQHPGTSVREGGPDYGSAEQAPLLEEKVRDLLENLETLQKIQPKNVGSLQIDMEFKNKAIADQVVRKYNGSEMQFVGEDGGIEGANNQGESNEMIHRFESPVQIEDGQQYFERYFGKIIQALDDYLMEEYAEWFEQFNRDLEANSGSQAEGAGGARGGGLSQAPSEELQGIDGQRSYEQQLIREHKQHKRLFSLIVYLQIVSIKLCIGDKLPGPSGESYQMEMFIVHKNQREPREHDLTAVCLHVKDGSPQVERSKSQGLHSASLKTLFAESVMPGQQEPYPWNQMLSKDSLSDHYFLQLVCRQYLKAFHLQFEDPEASESEGNLSNSSESVDSHGLDDSQSDAASSKKAGQAAKVKLACLKVDQIATVCHKRSMRMFQSQLGDFRFPAPITCELLAWKRNDRVVRYLGVRISVHDTQRSEDDATLFLLEDESWPISRPSNPSLETLMTTVGFDYLMDNCIDFSSAITTVESPQPLQTNSALARDYLGMNAIAADLRFDRAQAMLRHDKIDFPNTDIIE